MRAQGWLFLLAAILVAKINGVLLMSGICLYWQNSVNTTNGNICLCWATFGKQFCPSGASIVPILNPNRSLGLACILYF